MKHKANLSRKCMMKTHLVPSCIQPTIYEHCVRNQSNDKKLFNMTKTGKHFIIYVIFLLIYTVILPQNERQKND